MSILVIKVPHQYLSDRMTPHEREFMTYLKEKEAEYKRYGQATFFLPSEVHPETKEPLFQIEIKGD